MAEKIETTAVLRPDSATRYYAPTLADQERIEGYEAAEEMLDLSEHIELFNIKNEDVKASYIPFDFAGMISRLMRHYTFSPGFAVRAVNATKKGRRKHQAHHGQQRRHHPVP